MWIQVIYSSDISVNSREQLALEMEASAAVVTPSATASSHSWQEVAAEYSSLNSPLGQGATLSPDTKKPKGATAVAFEDRAY